MNKPSAALRNVGDSFLCLSDYFQYTGSKMIQLGSITATARLIVFPVSYIINDCIAEVWGFRKARFIIWTGFLMNLARRHFHSTGDYPASGGFLGTPGCISYHFRFYPPYSFCQFHCISGGLFPKRLGYE